MIICFNSTEFYVFYLFYGERKWRGEHFSPPSTPFCSENDCVRACIAVLLAQWLLTPSYILFQVLLWLPHITDQNHFLNKQTNPLNPLIECLCCRSNALSNVSYFDRWLWSGWKESPCMFVNKHLNACEPEERYTLQSEHKKCKEPQTSTVYITYLHNAKHRWDWGCDLPETAIIKQAFPW